MDQAGLHPGLREDGLDRLGEAGQPVDAADQDVGDAACLEVGQDLQPELGALATMKLDPHIPQMLVISASSARSSSRRVS